jgi:hypothetical protein
MADNLSCSGVVRGLGGTALSRSTRSILGTHFLLVPLQLHYFAIYDGLQVFGVVAIFQHASDEHL